MFVVAQNEDGSLMQEVPHRVCRALKHWGDPSAASQREQPPPALEGDNELCSHGFVYCRFLVPTPPAPLCLTATSR